MKLKYKLLTVFASIAIISLPSCNRNDDGCTDPNATNYDSGASDDDGTCEYDVTAPASYEYTDTEGNSTVSYIGQHQRLNMLTEMVEYMKLANTSGVVIEGATLISMFGNEGYTWDDDEGIDLNSTTKQLRNKTAGGDATIVAQFEGWMNNLGEASTSTEAGAMGVTGVVVSTSNPSKQYLMGADGQEFTQLIEKGLMGACFYYNISSVYLSAEKMDVDNSEPVDPEAGKFYTTMEHHWDEAYGYLTESTTYPQVDTYQNRFWAKYAMGRNEILGSADKLSEAFRLGRAAISEDIMAVRDQQITIINQELEIMIGGTAIHYLNDAVENYSDDALRNHQLSEAKAFIMALPYGAETSVDFAASEAILAIIGDDFYKVTTESILEARDELAAALGLTVHAEAL